MKLPFQSFAPFCPGPPPETSSHSTARKCSGCLQPPTHPCTPALCVDGIFVFSFIFCHPEGCWGWWRVLFSATERCSWLPPFNLFLLRWISRGQGSVVSLNLAHTGELPPSPGTKLLVAALTEEMAFTSVLLSTFGTLGLSSATGAHLWLLLPRAGLA